MPPPTTTTRARSGKLALVTGGSPVIMLRFSESGTGARLLPASICGRICAVCGRPGVVRPTAVCQLLAAGELAVADSVRPSCLGSEALDLVLLGAALECVRVALVRTLHSECGNVGPTGNLALPVGAVGVTPRDGLPDVRVRVDSATRLLAVCDLYHFTDLDRSGVAPYPPN